MSRDNYRAAGRRREAPPPLTLHEACVRAGLDRHGERCPGCPVRELCQSDLHWLVKAAPEQPCRF